MLTDTDILDKLSSADFCFPPLKFSLVQKEVRVGERVCDALIEAEWEKQTFRFAAEVKRYSSDRTIMEAQIGAKYAADQFGISPLVVVPFLSSEQLQRLERDQMSGIDLSGNGVVIVPGRLFIFRSGKPNLYPDSRTVKNPYDGNTSLVARTFLLRSAYNAVNEILGEILFRGGSITQPTVSKALKQLEEDVVIFREPGNIKLLQPDKILNRLVANVEPPRKLFEVSGKMNADWRVFFSKSGNNQTVVSGASSVDQYATMAREPLITLYCSADIRQMLAAENVEFDENSRFPNIRIIQTDDRTAFYDTRTIDGVRWASPIQTYLELMNGDNREKSTAEQVRQYILKAINWRDSK